MTNKASSPATSALTARITGVEGPVVEQSSLAINLGEAIEPLCMGGVTFYGESARVIRDAQAVLQAAGSGQLEVVKRANEPGEPFVVIDGQVFINDAVVSKAKAAPLAQELLDEIQSQISSSKLGADLESRIAEIELSRVAERGQKDASEILLEQRLAKIEAAAQRQTSDLMRELAESILRELDRNQCDPALNFAKQSVNRASGPRFGVWPGSGLYAGAAEAQLTSATHQPKPE